MNWLEHFLKQHEEMKMNSLHMSHLCLLLCGAASAAEAAMRQEALPLFVSCQYIATAGLSLFSVPRPSPPLTNK